MRRRQPTLRCTRQPAVGFASGAAHQSEASRQIRPALVLVLQLGQYVERLAEILLMQALPLPIGIDLPVVAFD